MPEKMTSVAAMLEEAIRRRTDQKGSFCAVAGWGRGAGGGDGCGVADSRDRLRMTVVMG